jgi:hypothetical protein
MLSTLPFCKILYAYFSKGNRFKNGLEELWVVLTGIFWECKMTKLKDKIIKVKSHLKMINRGDIKFFQFTQNFRFSSAGKSRSFKVSSATTPKILSRLH